MPQPEEPPAPQSPQPNPGAIKWQRLQPLSTQYGSVQQTKQHGRLLLQQMKQTEQLQHMVEQQQQVLEQQQQAIEQLHTHCQMQGEELAALRGAALSASNTPAEKHSTDTSDGKGNSRVPPCAGETKAIEHQTTLQPSMWDATLLIGTAQVGRVASAYMVALLLLNILMQATFIYLLANTGLTGKSYDEDAVADYRLWRYLAAKLGAPFELLRCPIGNFANGASLLR